MSNQPEWRKRAEALAIAMFRAIAIDDMDLFGKYVRELDDVCWSDERSESERREAMRLMADIYIKVLRVHEGLTGIKALRGIRKDSYRPGEVVKVASVTFQSVKHGDEPEVEYPCLVLESAYDTGVVPFEHVFGDNPRYEWVSIVT